MNRMHSATARSTLRIISVLLLALTVSAVAVAPEALAAAPAGTAGAGQHAGGGEANLRGPDLGQVVVGGVNGRTLLLLGQGGCVLRLLFGVVVFTQVRGMPVHPPMREISGAVFQTRQ